MFFATFVFNPSNSFSSCLQSLLCSRSINIASALPVLEPLTEADNVGLTIRVLCNTHLGKYEEAIDQLLKRCPDAAVFYAQHELKGDNQVRYFQYSYSLLTLNRAINQIPPDGREFSKSPCKEFQR